jgi:hypothetical protein
VFVGFSVVGENTFNNILLRFFHCVSLYNSHVISAADFKPVIRFLFVPNAALHIAINKHFGDKVMTSNDHGVFMHLNRYHWSNNIFCSTKVA